MERIPSPLILAIVFSAGLSAIPMASAAGERHFSGRSLDIGRVDGQTARKQKTKKLRARASKRRIQMKGEVFVKLPGSTH